MKLGLGAVQFGLDYGVTNTAGKTPAAEVRAILAAATAHGVTTLDTAALYGDSESVLGQQLTRPHNFRIVSKTLHLDAHLPLVEALNVVRTGVRDSLQKLGETKLYALLVHRIDDLLGPAGEALFDELLALREQGLVEKIGASVYAPNEVAELLQRFAIDIVQLPINVLDQRMLESGMLAELRKRHIEIHARSAFLQGVLLDEKNRPAHLVALQPMLTAFSARLRELGVSPLAGTLGFLNGLDAIDVAICGAPRLIEWQEICRTFATLPKLPPDAFKDLAQSDVHLIDPRHWPALTSN